MNCALEQFKTACAFPGKIDALAVEKSLHAYCASLGVKRKIVKINRGWNLADYPDLSATVHEILTDAEKRSGRQPKNRAAIAARAANAARDARASFILMKKFAEWCIYRRSWWWTGELSWLSTTHVGAVQIDKQSVLNWSQHVFDAYVAGAWLLVWTKNTLYWVEKPEVATELVGGGRKRLHNAEGPALRCDVENLYFWHGVLVPAFVVVRPEWITLKHIENELNAEVRRIMIDRYGPKKYLEDSGATVIQECASDHYLIGLRSARLLRKEVPDDEPIVMVDLLNYTPEPDGSTKRYLLRVDPNAYSGDASKDCLAAVASTWRNQDGSLAFKRPQDYAPVFES